MLRYLSFLFTLSVFNLSWLDNNFVLKLESSVPSLRHLFFNSIASGTVFLCSKKMPKAGGAVMNSDDEYGLQKISQIMNLSVVSWVFNFCVYMSRTPNFAGCSNLNSVSGSRPRTET